MTAEKVLSLAHVYWRRVGPQPLWFVLDAKTGEILAWSLPKRGAQKFARGRTEPCLLARIAPGGY